MKKHILTGSYFSPLIKDYLADKDMLHPFYSFPFRMEGFENAHSNRQFSIEKRATLVSTLRKQSEELGKLPQEVLANIESLSKENTFTVTTGHQIGLLAGPLYFVYKIASAIKLAQELNARFPDKHFVPVYWAATEDHDFEEIRSVFLNGKTYAWNTGASGATGAISTQGIEAFFAEMESTEGEKLSFNRIYQIFKKAWTSQPDLSSAVRRAVYDLFGKQGIVCVDAQEKDLKQSFSDVIRKELFHQFSNPLVQETGETLRNLGYKTQVEPREINLFYLQKNIRERIVFEQNTWQVLHTDIRFTADELEKEITDYPERFSPNVVLRPLYQECILPNIAYVGGAAEIMYWMQLKQVFIAAHVDFPVLVPRDGFAFLPEKEVERFLALGLPIENLLKTPAENLKTYVQSMQGNNLSVQSEIKAIQTLIEELKQRYAGVLSQPLDFFSATEHKLTKELEKLEKKALRSAARNENETAGFLQSVHKKLYPGGILSERKESIIAYWGLLGDSPIEKLVELCEPLNPGLKLIIY
ncbi:MAG: bacillithiol biosynthesis cysteine-adding enzyme BshC [Flavobacteriales bacterium]|nr:bacillithiol biosynthesis cysteine-adding enzyme BshC [Flavobacteriales bacterium]